MLNECGFSMTRSTAVLRFRGLFHLLTTEHSLVYALSPPPASSTAPRYSFFLELQLSADSLNMASNPTPRVLLRVDAKRGREDSVGDGDDCMLPPVVRVRMDTLGLQLPELTCLQDGDAKREFVFRRLQSSSTRAVQQSHAPPLQDPHAEGEGAVGASHPLQVSRFIRGEDYLLVDCTSASSAPSREYKTLSQEEHLYVLDSSQPMPSAHVSEEACDPADDFNFDAFSFGTQPAKPPLFPGGQTRGKRPTTDGLHGSNEPAYYLSPSRRLEDAANTPFNGTNQSTRAHTSLYEQGTFSTLNDLYRAYEIDEVDASLQDLENCIYMYPDHRKDDEYDSNAEDFSGNDYPDDADEGDYDGAVDMDAAECVDGEDETRPTRHGRDEANDGYGMYFEDDYVEPRLGKGWESEEDDPY